ncbi:MAG: ABC transporter permease [Anaerolineales bacterium]|nr:ABC transporter permease [Anaerolineales bacterium]
MLRRIRSLAVKEFFHLRYDWWLPAFMLIGGVLELVLVGWATSRPITNLPLVVLDNDRSTASQEVISALENTGTFSLEALVPDWEAIQDAMERGEIYAAVIIPPDFAEEMASSVGNPTLAVVLNGSESVPATTALRAVEGLAREMGQEIIVRRLGIDPQDFAGFDFSVRTWFNESLSEAYYTTPAELALMLEFTVMLFAALSFSRERELGTLEQLLVMPFSSLEIIVGKAIPVILIGFVDFSLMLIMVHLVFGVPVRGSLSLLLALAFGYLLVELSKGMAVSVFSRSQHQAFLLVMIIGFIDIMFTGYAAPVESMPLVLQYVANIIPAHHWLAILRGIMLKGADLQVLWPNVLALALLGLVIGTVSLRYVRRALS